MSINYLAFAIIQRYEWNTLHDTVHEDLLYCQCWSICLFKPPMLSEEESLMPSIEELVPNFQVYLAKDVLLLIQVKSVRRLFLRTFVYESEIKSVIIYQNS